MRTVQNFIASELIVSCAVQARWWQSNLRHQRDARYAGRCQGRQWRDDKDRAASPLHFVPETAVRDSDHDLGQNMQGATSCRGRSSSLSQSAKTFSTIVHLWLWVQGPHWLWLYTSGTYPAVLHVCKESREQGLKHYARLLQRPLGDINHVPDTIIYMNHAEDTLCILPHNKVQPIDAGFYIAVTSGFPTTSRVKSCWPEGSRLVIPIPPTARFVDYPTMIILKCTCQLKEVVFQRTGRPNQNLRTVNRPTVCIGATLMPGI